MLRLVILSFLSHSLVVAVAATPGRADEQLLDGIAAQVGAEIVLISEVQELARPVAERMRAGGAPDAQVQNMYAEALERLIESRLIEGVVVRFELQATEGEVDAAIMGIAQDTGLTIEQLERSVESHGLSIEEYRAKLKGEIERSKVLNAMVRSRVRVDIEEVRRAYAERFGDQPEGGEEVHLRHILVATSGESLRTSASACSIARDAERKIKGGEIAFPDMARRVTDMNPQAEGELGWLFVTDLAPWMADPVARMQPGQVSDVIETSFGCNLLQLVERRAFRPVTFEEAEEALTAELSRQKMDKEYLDWLETLRQQTFVSRKGLYAEGRRRVEDGAVGPQ
ncbi:MAG: peptidylprolyl isomerase [Deltaproteobacteria bacterium]|nr:peptidylprolyl isomerase [Deltaproteobacteria bacterium]